MGTETQFRTFQTVKAYEDALARHGQWCRWVKVLTCPCITPETGQPSISCPLCKGRGRIYKNPGPFTIEQEITPHDGNGRVYPKFTPVVAGSASVWRQGVSLPLGSQPADGSYIQLAAPYPRNYQRVRANYTFDPTVSVTSEDSEVYDSTNAVLRVTAARFQDRGKSYEGSIDAVTRVRNTTRSEDLVVSEYRKEFIYLESLQSWQSGDVLEVDYTYVQPFDFMLHSISARRRYDSAYVIDQADATLVTPYWAQVSPKDLITSLSAVIPAFAVIDPTNTAGNDEVGDYYDLSSLTNLIGQDGTEYVIGTNVVLHGRNELRWLTAKPTQKYTVHFLYHPTFTALTTYDTARSSENKSFVNRTNVMMFDKISREIQY